MIRNEAYKRYIERTKRERKKEYNDKGRNADKICRRKKRTPKNNKVINMQQDFKEENTRNANKHLKH